MAYRFGIDAGSKTVKVVILDKDGTPLHSVYRRHLSNIRETLTDLIHNLAWRYGDLRGTATVTGSAGIALADMLGLPFAQEVIATTRAVRETYPEADAVIELGGEDAKVMYLSGNPEQRMNATCAGGTGGFIDTIAFMLGMTSRDMSRLAGGASRIYPIASRCAVFAQTDVRPLLNAGAKKSDIAASALEAVVRQTITGLACGRPITGTVIFLGGPCEYIPDLVQRFCRALGLKRGCGIKPRYAHVFTAQGAALLSGEDPANREVSLTELEDRIRRAAAPKDDLPRLEPLFENTAELDAFKKRHAFAGFPRRRLFDCEGPLYVGLDAGSTTVKMAVIDDAGNLVHSGYWPTEGDALATAADMLIEFRQDTPHAYGSDESPVWVAHATACGYGERLLQTALGVDSGIVETTAHARAALALVPDATFVLDIGGQDMKALWIKNGMVANAILNEACSSGCGSFIEGTAHSLKTSPYAFNDAALTAKSPVDLGTKCTVFMTSRVRHAQKIGASTPDLAAGIAYSVVKNALYRIIGAERTATLGNKVVVQGGTFKSDAVLRAFEKTCGIEAVRPDTAHLMGAIGCALVARERAHAKAERAGGMENVHSSLLSAREAEELEVERFSARCPGCANNCLVSVADFGGGRQLVSDNRCGKANAYRFAKGQEATRREGEPGRPHGAARMKSLNAVAAEQRLLGRFRDEDAEGPRASVRLGIMNCFESYEYLPFWQTLFMRLGFSVAVPDDERAKPLEQKALATVPAESACFPAKTAHTRLFDLVEAGSNAVFMPVFERMGHCAVASEYALALRDSVPALAKGAVRLAAPRLHSFKASRIVESAEDRRVLLAALRELCPPEAPLEASKFEGALAEALSAQEHFFAQVEEANGRVIDWLSESPEHHAIVIAGRPYHTDARFMRGIDHLLGHMGLGILSPTGLEKWAPHMPHRDDCPPWKPGKHLRRLARFAAQNEQVDLVCLQSFGCAYDALSLEDARDALEEARKPFTALKIDDLSDKAHILIRLRTLAESIEMRQRAERSTAPASEAGIAQAPAPNRQAVDERKAETSVEQEKRAREDEGNDAGTSPSQPRLDPKPTADQPASGSGRTELYLACGADEITKLDVECARREIPGDVCSTAAVLMAKAVRTVRENPQVETLHIPYVCNQCLLDGLAHTVQRLCGRCPEIVWEKALDAASAGGPEAPTPQPDAAPASALPPTGPANGSSSSATPSQPTTMPLRRVRVGIVGNPLLCFDSHMNDGVVELLQTLGCDVALPEADALFTEDVRYLDQLNRFSRENVDCVIYLQSFGCVKAHVHARGFMRAYAERYPAMPIVVVDYDPESSALNRENRIRLAVEAAQRKAAGE